MLKRKCLIKRIRLITFISFVSFFTSGCATVGRNFTSDCFLWIILEKTTKEDVHSRLGEPFRVGIDDEKLTWTYGYYKYRAIGSTLAKDLVFYFNSNGTVHNHTFSTNFPAEKDKWLNWVQP